MTQLIHPTDPQYFSQTSDGSYDRHVYKLNVPGHQSIVIEDYEILRAVWFEKCRLFTIRILGSGIPAGMIMNNLLFSERWFEGLSLHSSLVRFVQNHEEEISKSCRTLSKFEVFYL